MLPIASIALIPIFAVADRLVGSGRRSFGMALAVIGAGIVGYEAAGLALAACGVVWMLYRSLPFKGGSGAPQSGGELAAAAIRHVPALLVAVPAFWANGPHIERLAALVGLYAIAATSLAAWYGDRVIAAKHAGQPSGRENEIVETMRGALFGAALCIWALS